MTPTTIESMGRPVTVTLLEANHCPGAVMFLFRTCSATTTTGATAVAAAAGTGGGRGRRTTRTVLHVGDFRWSREVMVGPDSSPLREFASLEGGTTTTLDDLFLDTTYCDPTKDLPSQEAAIEATVAVFGREITATSARRGRDDTPGRTLHLFGAYTIGKERMYLSVAERFGLKVYVDPARHRILSALDWPRERMNLLTRDRAETCIWVVPLGHINMKKMPEYLSSANSKPFAPRYDRVVGYRPTGWSMPSKPGAGLVSTRSSGNLAIHSVPYSEHSSFPELVDCLACLRPARIVPTVNVSTSDEQVATLLKGIRTKQTKLFVSSEAEDEQ
jgi:DNA cross-link repair 1A protein